MRRVADPRTPAANAGVLCFWPDREGRGVAVLQRCAISVACGATALTPR
jgi:hypothetical protein